MIRDRKWVFIASILLSFNGGYINCLTLVSFLNNSIGYVTGNIALAGISLVDLELNKCIQLFLLLIAFLIGATISGLIIKKDGFSRNNRYEIILFLEASLIFFSMLGLVEQDLSLIYLLACALGLQNAMTTFYGKNILRTTHMTGTMTDLGLMLGHKLKKIPVENWRINLNLILLSGFFIGNVVGAIFYFKFHFYSLLLSIFICILMVINKSKI